VEDGSFIMKVLIIEDEKGLADSIASHLSLEGLVCETVYNYRDASEKIALYKYDCIVVDINLPDGNGFTIIESMKRTNCTSGIIIISARDSVDDRIKGLEIGSDDYLIKPFYLSELNARIKSLMRRRNFGGSNEIEYGEIRVELLSRKVFVNNQEKNLTRKEYDLLLYFLSNQDIVLTRTSIAEHVWGDNIDSADSLDVVYSQIKNLRRKLTEDGCANYIHSVYGIGYKFGKA
jgi:DNA-binding response OmpR family regulator